MTISKPALYSEIMKIRGEKLFDVDEEGISLSDSKNTESDKSSQKALKTGKGILYAGIAAGIIYMVVDFSSANVFASVCIGEYIILVSVALNFVAKEVAGKLERKTMKKREEK